MLAQTDRYMQEYGEADSLSDIVLGGKQKVAYELHLMKLRYTKILALYYIELLPTD